MEVSAAISLATLVILVTAVVMALLKQRGQQARLQEIADRLNDLEAGKEAAAKVGFQMAETYDAARQLLAGFSAIQGQLTDFSNGQRVARDAVTELKSGLPSAVADRVLPILNDSAQALNRGNLQAAERFQAQTTGLNDRFTELQRTALDKIAQGLQDARTELAHMHQALIQERTASEKRFNELRDGLQAAQREFTDKSAADGAHRGQELDTKLAAYRREVETKLQANAESVQQLIKSIEDRFTTLSNTNTEAIHNIRDSVGKQLKEMRDDNAVKLEAMRRTVDEKLQATLETRLGESFKLVSERLEQVHRGLGEMQTLASGVGDLKRVLTNVKTRGTWGEMQLSRLLEQMLTAEQYVANVSTKKGSNDRVEFAIRLPGKEDDVEVFLPIDAKFPIEDYQRLLDAQDRADLPAIEDAAKALEIRIKGEARKIHDKYIDPPNTTDFALLYLPIEGLYAEVLRRPGLIEMLQREYRVTVAGPTTLTAILNSLQMGFRTLAITRRSSEVWKVLGAVKTEFSKFGDIIEAAKRKIEAASKHFEQVDVRTRAIQRKLRNVEALPTPATQDLLDIAYTTAGNGDKDEGAPSPSESS